MSDSGRKIRVQLVGFAEVLKAGDGIFGLIFLISQKIPVCGMVTGSFSPFLVRCQSENNFQQIREWHLIRTFQLPAAALFFRLRKHAVDIDLTTSQLGKIDDQG